METAKNRMGVDNKVASFTGFVILLFVQIVSREVFGHSFSWIEELSVYMKLAFRSLISPAISN